MTTRKIMLLVILLFCPLSTGLAIAGDIQVSAAASTKDALMEIIGSYKKTRPDINILTNFGAAGALAKQIIQGAPADLFISANEKWLELVIKEGRGEKTSRQVLAYNRLVFVGKEGIAVKSLAEVKGLQNIAIGTPASVPAGQYAEQAMQAAGIYENLRKEKKLVMAQDVRQALLYADRGEVDGAFVYKTDALLAEHAQILFIVPDTLYDRITYPIVLTTNGAARDEVKAFYKYLGSPESKAILQKFGFETTE